MGRLRYIARGVLFLALRSTGVPFLLRETVQRRRVTILCFHDPSAEQFRRHLAVLWRHYNFISLQRYMEWRVGKIDALPSKPLIVTIDDGHRNNHQLLDLINHYGVPVTIFLCSAIVGTNRHFWWKRTRWIETVRLKRVKDVERIAMLEGHGFNEQHEYDERQALSTSEVHTLKGFIDLQSHTRFHPILPRCSDQRAEDEIIGSKRELNERFGIASSAFAYPNGDYSARDVDLVKRAGYACAVTTHGGYNTKRTDPFLLRRMMMADSASVSEILVKASGLWCVFRRFVSWRDAWDASPAVKRSKTSAVTVGSAH